MFTLTLHLHHRQVGRVYLLDEITSTRAQQASLTHMHTLTLHSRFFDISFLCFFRFLSFSVASHQYLTCVSRSPRCECMCTLLASFIQMCSNERNICGFRMHWHWLTEAVTTAAFLGVRTHDRFVNVVVCVNIRNARSSYQHHKYMLCGKRTLIGFVTEFRYSLAFLFRCRSAYAWNFNMKMFIGSGQDRSFAAARLGVLLINFPIRTGR